MARSLQRQKTFHPVAPVVTLSDIFSFLFQSYLHHLLTASTSLCGLSPTSSSSTFTPQSSDPQASSSSSTPTESSSSSSSASGRPEEGRSGSRTQSRGSFSGNLPGGLSQSWSESRRGRDSLFEEDAREEMVRLLSDLIDEETLEGHEIKTDLIRQKWRRRHKPRFDQYLSFLSSKYS